jgi:hypothetical protein
VPAGGVGVFRVDTWAVGDEPGRHETRWRLESVGGLVGNEIVRPVEVAVGALAFDDGSVEAPGSIPGGTSGRVVVRVRNVGTATWRREGADGVVLGLRGASSGWTIDSGSWLSPQVAAGMLEREVAPGEVATFAFTVGAPAGAAGVATIELAPVSGDAWVLGTPVRALLRAG